MTDVSKDALAVCFTLGIGLTGVSATLAALFGDVSYPVGAGVQLPMVAFIVIVGWVVLAAVATEIREALRGPEPDPDAGVDS